MIKVDDAFLLDGVKSSLCMQFIPVEHSATTVYSTQSVLAVIRHRVTTKRTGPPACGNGFETAYLPFAKGHVIALELGGSDASFNVVPQFEDWQGKANGAWRRMEIELQNPVYANHIMFVEIGYGRTGIPEDHDSAHVAFASNRLRTWTDPRIPDSFKIGVWKANTNVSGIKNDADFNHEVNLLKQKDLVFYKEFTLGEEMPQPDRSNYINQFGLNKAIEQYEKYCETKGEKDVSFVSFMLKREVIDEIRDDLMDVDEVTPTEAQGIQAYPIIFAYQKGVSESKVRKQFEERGRRNKKSIDEKDLWNKKRDASPKRKPPGKWKL